MSSSSNDNNATEEEENEEHGPKVGIKISLDQADLIIQRHFPTYRAISLSHINRGYNNRVYIVTTIDQDNDQEKGEFILRLAGRFWSRLKTENEVCALLYLSREFPSLPTPKVFGYCTDRDKSGVNAEYIVMEKLKGEPLEHLWNKLELESKMGVVNQLVKILAQILKVNFSEIGAFHFASESIGNSSGIGVDPQNDILSCEDEILKIGEGVECDGGPFPTYLDYFRSACETEMAHLRKCDFMKEGEGYENRLKRIEKFVEAFKRIETVPDGLDKTALENVPFVFCHGDLELQNILVDKDSLEITGLIDFEWTGSYPIDEEWFSGFTFVNANTNEDRVFNEERSDQEKQEVDNFIREYFLAEMRKNGVPVPDDIPGHLTRAELFYFKGYIIPWWLREKRDPRPESHYGDRSHACKLVDGVLDKYGF